MIETETIDKLYLELSQFTKAKTSTELWLQERVSLLEDLLTSAHTIAKRDGENTDWERFSRRLTSCGIGCITAKHFFIPIDDT